MQTRKMIPIVLVLLCLTSGITYAVTQILRPVTVTGTIISAPNIQVYSDSACTTPIAAFTVKDLKRGEFDTKNVWAKNIGDVKLFLTWALGTGSAAYVTVTMTCSGVAWTAGTTGGSTDFNPGVVFPIVITITAKSDALLDTPYSFVITFENSV